MKNVDDLSLIGKIFWNKYKIIKKIGQGSFGRIYQGINLFTEELYAIKFEDINEKSELLGKEAIFLYYLKGPGIPDIHLYDTTDNYHILIESLLGKSLEVLFLESLYSFSIKDVAMIGIQILYRLEYIHNKYIIHRDIKPDNFVIGREPNNSMIYIIDFGLAKKYRSSKTLEHIKFRLTKKLTGTTRYASVNALKGGEQSRRDDLESLAYMLFYFLRGNLPWQGAKGLTKEERYKKIYKIKKSTQPDELCMNLPEEFKFLLLYVKNLEFEEDPNYDYCRGLLENVLKKMNEKADNNFSWFKGAATCENKLRNQKQNVKKNFGQSIINTTGQTQKSMAVSNLINSMKSFHQNQKLINRISVIISDNKKDSLLNKFNNNYNNNEEDKNNSIYKKIKVRNNSTECRNTNNKNNNFTLNNSLIKGVDEKIKYYKNQEEKNNNLNNGEDKADIPKLNTNIVNRQYINFKKSFRNEKNDNNNPSTNHEKKTSKERKFTKKNVYENQINEYKNKFKKSNIKANENKKGHMTTNSIYLRNITQKDLKIKTQKKNNKLNDSKIIYNKMNENSFEFVTSKKIYLTRRNSIIDRTIMNSYAKRETNVNSLRYSPKRNNKAKKIKNIKNYYTNSELNIYPNKISRKINIPKRHLFANNNIKKDISIYLENNNLNNTLKITNRLSNKLFNKENVIKKKNLNKDKNLNNDILKNKFINDNKNRILVPKKYLFLTNNNSINMNPNVIYDNQLKKLAMNKKKKTRNNNNQLNLSNNEKSRITKYILNRDKTAYIIDDKKYIDNSMEKSKINSNKNYNKTFNNNIYDKNISVKPTSPINNSSSKRKRATPNRINNIEFKKIKINLNKFKLKENRNNKNKNKLNIEKNEKKKILSFNINNKSLPENILSMYERHRKMNNKNDTRMTGSNSKNKNNSINDKYLSNSISSNKNYESKFCSKTLSNEKIFPNKESNKIKSLKKCNILKLMTDNNDQNIKINYLKDNKNDINDDKAKNLVNRICYSNIVNNHKKNRIKINLNNYSNYFMYNSLKKNSIMINSNEGMYDDIFKFYRINSNQSSFSDDNNKNNQFFHHKKALISNYNNIRNSQINNSNKNNYNSVNTNNSSFTNKFMTKDNSKNNTINDTEKKTKESPYNIVSRNINQNKNGNKFLYFKH